MVASCDEPETVITNYVHPDGSVTRKIVMRNDKNSFNRSDLQVPFDSTWVVKDSIETDPEGDTIWIKRAEKHFKNVAEINLAYKADSGANKKLTRDAYFKKRFKWFNTEYRFSEKIEKQLPVGYPLKEFLNSEELSYFYSPDNLKLDKATGPDSIKYKSLSDSVNRKTDQWTTRNLIKGWITEFSLLLRSREGGESVGQLMELHENDFVNMINLNDKDLDSLWSNGIILKKFITETEYNTFRLAADSAIEKVADRMFVDFKNYSVRVGMPGKLIGTNGFIDSSQLLIWPVKSDFFLTESYEMWAESKIPNIWAWVVSVIFLVFVLTGIFVRKIKKG
jgi:hypothetical protein